LAPLEPLEGLKAAVTARQLDESIPDGWIPRQKSAIDEAVRATPSAPLSLNSRESESASHRQSFAILSDAGSRHLLGACF